MASPNPFEIASEIRCKKGHDNTNKENIDLNEEQNVRQKFKKVYTTDAEKDNNGEGGENGPGEKEHEQFGQQNEQHLEYEQPQQPAAAEDSLPLISSQFYQNETGEAHYLSWTESCNTDYGLQNQISPLVMSQMLNHHNVCEKNGTKIPQVLIVDGRFDYEFQGVVKSRKLAEQTAAALALAKLSSKAK